MSKRKKSDPKPTVKNRVHKRTLRKLKRDEIAPDSGIRSANERYESIDHGDTMRVPPLDVDELGNRSLDDAPAPKKKSREDANQAAFRIVKEATKD